MILFAIKYFSIRMWSFKFFFVVLFSASTGSSPAAPSSEKKMKQGSE
jgi:hypothetical protein